MFTVNARGLIAVCGAAAALLSTPTTSQACWLFGHCCKRPTYAAQPVCAPVCAPACPPQQVSYVPQTCYRTVYSCVPVTTCRPVTTCDPCTGCPVTVMRPSTSYVQQAQLVPYTTYRPVVTQAAYANPCATGACGVGTAASYAPAASYYPSTGYAPTATYAAPAPAANCCPTTTSAATSYTPTYPTTPAPTMAPMQTSPGPAPMTNGGGATTAPSLPPVNNGTQYQQNYQPSQPALTPIPNTNPSSMPAQPLKLLDPQNRTAWRGGPTFVPVTLATRPTPAPAAQPTPVNFDVWHAMGR